MAWLKRLQPAVNKFITDQGTEYNWHYGGKGASLISDGARIVFDFEGPGANLDAAKPLQLLVLVNGFQRTRQDFRAFRKRLRVLNSNILTLALDNRGAGESECDLNLCNMQLMAQDVQVLAHEALKAFNLHHYSVLGISMGGMIAQTVANYGARQNTELNKLILVSTTAGGSLRVWPHGVDPQEAQNNFRAWPQDLSGMRSRMEKYFGERFLKSSPLLFDTLVKNMLKAFESNSGQANERSMAQFKASAGFDGVQGLQNIGSDVLVVTGSDDKIIPKGNALALAQSLPRAQLVEYSAAGHLILIEEPDIFVHDVNRFLTS